MGNWKLHNGAKAKHGQGKITFPSAAANLSGEIGSEEYEGDWEEDLMHGYGTYKYTSGALYSGSWTKGKQNGKGKMQYADGSSYIGQWLANKMHGEGIYVDSESIRWEGIFVNGSFESKLQKKLQAEKIIKEKRRQYEEKAREFFQSFANEARCNLHLELLYGDEPHHIVEALFKAFARAVDAACRHDPRIAGRLPSTKGKL